MTKFNPASLFFVAFCVVIGALAGHWLAGAAVGLAIVLFATVYNGSSR